MDKKFVGVPLERHSVEGLFNPDDSKESPMVCLDEDVSKLEEILQKISFHVVLVGNEEDSLFQQLGISKERAEILEERVEQIFRDIYTRRKKGLSVSQSLAALSETCETVNELALFCLRLGQAIGMVTALESPKIATLTVTALFGTDFIKDQVAVIKEN